MDDVGRRAIGKVYRRVIAFILCAFFMAYLDRTNVAFAATELHREFGFTATIFGTGASIFFLSYVALTVPSTALLRWGPPNVWLSRMLILWGLISAGTIFIQGQASFYAVRLLLGAAEAGFFPFIVAYTSAWLPDDQRSRMMGIYLVGIPLAGVFGGPASGLLLDVMDGVGSMAGWRWMFLIEGLPATFLGLLGLRILAETPAAARWLEPDERAWLTERIEADRAGKTTLDEKVSLVSVCLRPSVLTLGLCYALAVFNMYGISFFLPQIIGETQRLSHTAIGFVSAIPMLVGAIAMVVVPWHADRQREYKWHAALSFLAGGSGFLIAGVTLSNPLLALVGLCLASAGVWATVPLILSVPLSLFSGNAIATVIAVLGGIGNLGSLVGPVATGVARDQTGDFRVPLYIFAATMVAAALLLLAAGRLQAGERRRAARIATDLG